MKLSQWKEYEAREFGRAVSFITEIMKQLFDGQKGVE